MSISTRRRQDRPGRTPAFRKARLLKPMLDACEARTMLSGSTTRVAIEALRFSATTVSRSGVPVELAGILHLTEGPRGGLAGTLAEAGGKTLRVQGTLKGEQIALSLRILGGKAIEADGPVVSATTADGRLTLHGGGLSGANLSNLMLGAYDMAGANLSGANLYRTQLGHNLTNANLTGANLQRAFLIRADLAGANLTRANLTGAVLQGANLRGAVITGEIGLSPKIQTVYKLQNSGGASLNLSNQDLSNEDLSNVNLTGANLSGDNLFGADLTGATLTNANFRGAKLGATGLTAAALTAVGAKFDSTTTFS